jgi:CBS domain-containing protein
MSAMPSGVDQRERRAPSTDVIRAVDLKVPDEFPWTPRRRPIVADVMATTPATVKSTDSLWTAAKRLVDHGGHLIVLERSQPIGVISEDDVLQHWPGSRLRARRLRIREIITGSTRCVLPDDDLATAAAVMDADATEAVPVIDRNDMTVGLLTCEQLVASTASDDHV